ncbi:MAG: hypothetical protein FWC70_03170 [Defluviitaleaceae bacterium]|nr:hypothetical protein [Defluviitaleaceae bacterium]
MILAVMPHPALAVPEVGGEISKISETVRAMDEISREIADFSPETIIFFTPHGTMYGDFFHVSPGAGATGDLSRFGASEPTFSLEYDIELTEEIARISEQQNFPAGTFGERDPALDHGVLVPVYYLNKFFTNYKIVRVSQSGLSTAAHFEMGAMVAAAAENLGRRYCVVASGDLSHKLGGSYGFAPEGETFDRDIMKFLREADFSALLAMPDDLLEAAVECGHSSFAMLAGCLAGREVAAKQLSYECPLGVGYGVVKFNA